MSSCLRPAGLAPRDSYLQSPADKTENDGRDDDGTGLGIGGFCWQQPDSFQDNSGRLIPAGSNLLLDALYYVGS